MHHWCRPSSIIMGQGLATIAALREVTTGARTMADQVMAMDRDAAFTVRAGGFTADQVMGGGSIGNIGNSSGDLLSPNRTRLGDEFVPAIKPQHAIGWPRVYSDLLRTNIGTIRSNPQHS